MLKQMVRGELQGGRTEGYMKGSQPKVKIGRQAGVGCSGSQCFFSTFSSPSRCPSCSFQ